MGQISPEAPDQWTTQHGSLVSTDYIWNSKRGESKSRWNIHAVSQSNWNEWQAVSHTKYNKANLRDLIAATGLVILLKLDLNRQFFSPCDLEIWWMTPKNNRAPLLCYFKLFASFRSHWWIQTGVTDSPETLNLGQNRRFFFSRVTLKFDGWPSKTEGHLFYATSSFVQHFVAIDEFKLELQSGNA